MKRQGEGTASGRPKSAMTDVPELTDNSDSGAATKEDPILEIGSVVTHSAKGVIHCLTIVGQIEGHQTLPENTKTTKYEHVLPLLAAIEESDEIEALLILLNTVGGDIEAGLAIAELIAGMQKPTASLVLGGGHSIGVPLAVAAKRSFIAPSAAMTIHPVRLTGVIIGAPQTWTTSQKFRNGSCSSSQSIRTFRAGAFWSS